MGQPSRRSAFARSGILLAIVLAGAVALAPAALAEPGSLAGTAPGAPAADGLTVEQLVDQLLTEPSGTRKGAEAVREDAATRLARRAALFAVTSGDPVAAITSAQSLVFALVAAADPAKAPTAPERTPRATTAPAVAKPAPVAVVPRAEEERTEEPVEKIEVATGSIVVPPGCGTRAAAALLAACLPGGGTIPGLPGGGDQPCVTKGAPGAVIPQVCDPEASKPAPVSDIPVGDVPVGGCPELWKMPLPGDPCANTGEPPHQPDPGQQPGCPGGDLLKACQPPGLPGGVPCQVWKAGGCDPVGDIPFEMLGQVAGDLGTGDDASGEAVEDEGEAGITNLDAIRDAIRISDAPSFLGAGL